MFRFVSLRHTSAILLAGLLIVFAALPGYAQDPGSASTINGEPIPQSEFLMRVRFVRWQYLGELEKFYELTGGNLGLAPQYVSNLITNLQNPVVLGDAVLTQMEEERLLWQEGQKLGLTPTAEDAAAQENAFFSLWTNVSVNELVMNPLAQQFIAEWYAEAIAISGLTADDIRYIFATEALRNRLYAYIAASVPTEELAVHTRHILCAFDPAPAAGEAPSPEVRVAAEGCIRAAQARLQAGESFEAVAGDLSADTASAANGGDVGWTILSYLVESYATVARDAELNTVAGPIETGYGLHLLEVLERGMQPLDEEQLAESQSGYFSLWLNALRDQATIERSATWGDGLPDQPGLDTLDPKIQQAVTQFMAN
ncbi:MAG: peptidylprolyl isomerase [Chloroflexi bacterium]|nr:peptidylprolyl isomerase [Chloroflexota bacterium]